MNMQHYFHFSLNFFNIFSTHHHLFLETWMSIHLCLPSTAAAGTAPSTSPLLFHTKGTTIKFVFFLHDHVSVIKSHQDMSETNYQVNKVLFNREKSVSTLLRPMLWYFFSMMLLTGSSSLNVMKQKPLLLFVLFSMGSSIDSTCSHHQCVKNIKQS